MRQFFWKGNNEGGGLAFVSWEIVYRPTNMGVLGVLDLSTLSDAMLSKWVSNIMSVEVGDGSEGAEGPVKAGLDWD